MCDGENLGDRFSLGDLVSLAQNLWGTVRRNSPPKKT